MTVRGRLAILVATAPLLAGVAVPPASAHPTVGQLVVFVNPSGFSGGTLLAAPGGDHGSGQVTMTGAPQAVPGVPCPLAWKARGTMSGAIEAKYALKSVGATVLLKLRGAHHGGGVGAFVPGVNSTCPDIAGAVVVEVAFG